VREVIGVSAYILERHRAFFPAGVGRRVIRHAIERPAEAGTPPPSGELRTIGYIGALDVVKGVGALLEALPGLVAAGVDVHVAGDGRLRDEVARAAASRTGVQYHGVVAGAVKSAFLGRCDAGIVPSVWAEPGAPPYAAVEWLAAGRPVLASSRGGLGEAASRFPGLIPVQPDPRGIEAAVRELRSPGRWAEAVDAASAPVGERGDRVRWLEEHLAVYRTVVSAT
jgi:glycosyltransferase involved in cell wall biosynthesis